MGDELKATSVHFGETGVTQSWEGSKFSPVLYITLDEMHMQVRLAEPDDGLYLPATCMLHCRDSVGFLFLPSQPNHAGLDTT
jgi:hypothetical protein